MLAVWSSRIFQSPDDERIAFPKNERALLNLSPDPIAKEHLKCSELALRNHLWCHSVHQLHRTECETWKPRGMTSWIHLNRGTISNLGSIGIRQHLQQRYTPRPLAATHLLTHFMRLVNEAAIRDAFLLQPSPGR